MKRNKIVPLPSKTAYSDQLIFNNTSTQITENRKPRSFMTIYLIGDFYRFALSTMKMRNKIVPLPSKTAYPDHQYLTIH